MATSLSLSGKVAIVTGAAGGLGKAIADKFLKNGASVVIADVNEERLATAEKELSALGPVLTFKTDITSEDAVKKLIAEAVAKFGSLDILVNNAGVLDRFDPVGELDKDLWDKVIAVNLTAPYLMSKYAVIEMAKKENPNAAILNIGSAGGASGFRAGAAYTTSKHGVVGLTKNTAAYYGKKGIRCNAIMPGAMATNIGDSLASGMNGEAFKIVQATMAVDAGMCELTDMADTALYLCSDASKVINGAIVAADKGWLAY